MKSHALGLGWLLWQRHRLGLQMTAGYLAFLALAFRWSPIGGHPETAIILTIPLMFALPFLVSVFTHPDCDVFAGRSGYPTHYFQLPVRTSALALWPMLFGAVAMAGTWLVFAGVILRPAIPAAPILWPAALLAAFTVALQALAWTPFPVGLARSALAILIVPVLLYYGIHPPSSPTPEWQSIAFSLGVLCVSAWAGCVGLARARRGDGTGQAWSPSRSRAELPSRIKPRFTSPLRAQVWYNWTRNGLLMPFVTLIGMLLLSGLMVSVSLKENAEPAGRFFGPFADLQPGAYLRIMLLSLGLPMFLGMLLDAGARKGDTRAADLTIHAFQATRPLSSVDLVLARIISGSFSTLLTWAVALAFIGAWLLLPAQMGPEHGALGALIFARLPPGSGPTIFLALALLVASTIRNQLCGLFVDLTGRKWIVQGFPLVFSLFFTAVMYVGAVLWPDPEALHKVLGYLPSVAYSLAGIKLTAAIATSVVIVRSGILGKGRLALLGAGWLGVAPAVFLCLRELMPVGMLTAWQLAIATFLWMPATRLALAPLSLHWNRHR